MDPATRRRAVGWFAGLALACVAAGPASGQGTAPAASPSFEALKGTWVRPDGGYRVVIRNVSANGQLEAMYFNPSELPFSQSQATRQGTQLRVSLELRAGGYDGSTYDLTYDPASDRLKGIYYQAVVKQKFDVYFVRK